MNILKLENGSMKIQLFGINLQHAILNFQIQTNIRTMGNYEIDENDSTFKGIWENKKFIM